MRLDWRRLLRRAALVAGLAGVAASALTLVFFPHRGKPAHAAREFRIGFQPLPPHEYVQDGKPAGPAVEVVMEAARRRGIALQWVLAPEGPERALQTGSLDLWPLVGILPERRTMMYLTDSWMSASVWMIAPRDSGILKPEDTAGRRVIYTVSNLQSRLAKTNFPNATLATAPSIEASLSAICEGRADAALALGPEAWWRLVRDSCADRDLVFVPLDQGRLGVGLGASLKRADAIAAADQLEEEIGRMTSEGVVSSIYFHWMKAPNSEAILAQYVNKVESQNYFIKWALAILCALLTLFFWQGFRLRSARREAVAANLSKSRFLANVSHEIRTPMNGVIGMTELAMETDSREEQREYLEMARLSSSALLGIINDILDVSKMEAGKLTLDPIPFALRETVLLSLRAVAMQAHRKGLELYCDIASDVPDLLTGDPDRLRQIIVNLAGNALKFTEHGEVGVEVRATSAAAGGTGPTSEIALQFTVRDTGIGIPKERQGAVFAAFSQADTSITRRYGGTGLGLTICKELAKMMRGRMWLESEPGRGTAAHFTAQFVVGAQAAATPSPKQDARVLIVDDNATVRRLLQAACERQGWRPTCAASGAEAVAHSSKTREAFDLVLLDLQMPDLEGFETLAQIRKANPAFRAQVIALGSIGYACDKSRRKELGIAATVTKPFLHDEVLRVAGEVLSRQPADEKTESVDGPTEPSLPPLNILVAEDNAVNQTLVRRLLMRRGHQVTIAANGKLALDAFRRARYDVILMDVQMPEMDGLTASLEIRAQETRERRERTPIIALTANAMTGDRATCMAAGMDGYVSKPIRTAELFGVIGDVCSVKEIEHP